MAAILIHEAAMTVSSEVSTAGPYNGNGVTTVFPYGFKIVDETHLRVVLRDPASVSTDLSLDDGDYTVSGVGNDAGGNVTVTVAPLTGYFLTILRNPPLTQETDLENQGPYSAEVVEARFDLITMQVQRVKEITDRTFQVAPGQDPPSLDLIEAAADNAAAASASAAAAAAQVPLAAAQANLAQKWATNPEDVVVSGGLFSAFHWYRKTLAIYNSVVAGFAAAIHAAASKATPVDADELGIADSAASFGLARLTLANLKAYIGALVAASQAQQEAASSNSVSVTPGTQKFHPSAAKAFACVTQSGGAYTLQPSPASFGVASITKNGTGDVTVTWTTAFSSALYAPVVSAQQDGNYNVVAGSTLAGSVNVKIRNGSTGALIDAGFAIIAYGDL